MNLYGIQGIALDWFRSYLTNRTQRCLVNGSLSRICSLKCGVPQGTILGPLLFLEGLNGVNPLATKGQKYYRLLTKREKNYRLPTEILTDYRHGPTLSIFFFSERREYWIISTFLGSNQRYHVTSLFTSYWYHKTRVLKSVCRAHENFFKASRLVLHITRNA